MRPSKRSRAPPPLYLRADGEVPSYCHTCGRVISARKSHEKASDAGTPVKFCSTRCRQNKPDKLEQEIETAFLSMLDDPSSRRQKRKGDPRNVVACNEVAQFVFGHRSATGEQRLGSRSKRAGGDEKEWKSVDMESPSASDDEDESGGVLLPTDTKKDNFRSHSKKMDDELLNKRREGQRRAEDLEKVKQAARRGCVFGFSTESTTLRKCEAVLDGKVVEPSFAKGDWSIRWREL